MVGIFIGCLVYCYGGKRPCLNAGCLHAWRCVVLSCLCDSGDGDQGPHASLGLVTSPLGHKETLKLIYCVKGNLLKLNVMVIKSYMS